MPDKPNLPSTEHLREEVQKIQQEQGHTVRVPPEMVQTTLETSDIDLDELSQGEYDMLFDYTMAELQAIAGEVYGPE